MDSTLFSSRLSFGTLRDPRPGPSSRIDSIDRSVDRIGEDDVAVGCYVEAIEVRASSVGEDEFYQLLSYRDDVDLEKKLAVWERFYNKHRPHGAHKGKTPYEMLREKLR